MFKQVNTSLIHSREVAKGFKYLILFMLIVNALLSFSQEETVILLKNELKLATNDTTRCKIYFKLYQAEDNPKEKIKHCVIWKELTDKNLSKLRKGSQFYLFYMKNKADYNNSFGISYAMLGNYKEAITYLTLALNTSEEINDKEGMHGPLANLGNVYRLLSDKTKAL